MNLCCQCVKGFFIVVNLAITMVGLLLLGCALWLFFDTFHFLQIAQTSSDYYRGTYVFMAAGVLITVVGFLGCVGACRDSPCLLGSFFTLVLLVFVAEVASIVWIHMNSEQIREEINKSMARAIKYEYGKVPARTQAVDVIQTQLSCCGAAGPSDWADSDYNRAGVSDDSRSVIDTLEIGVASVVGAYSVPPSCCAPGVDSAVCEASRSVSGVGELGGTISSEGCGERVVQFLRQHMHVVIGVVVGVMSLEAMAMLVSLCLCVTVVRTEHRYKA